RHRCAATEPARAISTLEAAVSALARAYLHHPLPWVVVMVADAADPGAAETAEDQSADEDDHGALPPEDDVADLRLAARSRRRDLRRRSRGRGRRRSSGNLVGHEGMMRLVAVPGL